VPDVIVPVSWVKQEETYYCGPAAAQMTLTALLVAPPATTGSWQDELWEQIKQETAGNRPNGAGEDASLSPPFPSQLCVRCNREWSCWSTTPDALARVLNQNQESAVFSVDVFNSENAAFAALVAGIDARVPSIPLVFGWQHWIVVEGYRHDEPGACNINGRAIKSLYIRDSNQKAIHEISCTEVKDDYLSFVPCGQYAERLVVVCGRRLGRTEAGLAKPTVGSGYHPVHAAEFRPPSPVVGTSVIPPESAAGTAQKAAADLVLSPRWKPALSLATQQAPVLVHRLDRDSYYYIFEHTIGGRVTARIIIDAIQDRFKQAIGIEESGDALPPFVDPTAHLKAAYGSRIRFPSLQERVLRPGTVGTHPVLVWRPCAESTSPFLPFFLLSVGDEFVYARVDGRRFTRLTLGPA
jgi:hypothetical protein